MPKAFEYGGLPAQTPWRPLVVPRPARSRGHRVKHDSRTLDRPPRPVGAVNVLILTAQLFGLIAQPRRSGSDQPQRHRGRSQAHRAWREKSNTAGEGRRCAVCGRTALGFDVRGLETERYGVTAPAPTNPTQPSAEFRYRLPKRSTATTSPNSIYGACPIRAVEDQIGPRRAEGIGLATALVKPC